MSRYPDDKSDAIYISQIESQMKNIGKKKGKGHRLKKQKSETTLKLKEYSAQFEYIKSTKNKHRYQEISNDPVVGDIYISKRAFKGTPHIIEVTIRVVG